MSTPSEINQAIARACGWTPFLRFDNIPFDPPRYLAPDGEMTHTEVSMPDFCNSLDAMHEAEKKLETDEQIEAYLENLTDICGGDVPVGQASFTAYFATALQRATAFCRVLNLETK